MKTMILAGILITLPAIVVIIASFFGLQRMLIPALVSLSINMLPFIVAGLLLKDKVTLGHH